MTGYTTVLPVHVRVGDRREWIVGDVPADHRGRVDPMALGALLIATGQYMHHLVAVEQEQKLRAEKATP